VSRIRILERSVAERIAAGEVVERPASVVKELLENSLDAGATTVTVEVEGAGLHVIRVLDDGVGIAAGDVPLAFERFATSKITRLEDLDGVQSFGFRGEALPSIAAVAQLTLTTRADGAASATRAVVAGGVVERVEAHGAPRGTTVEVRTLFFNTPARLKFLKSPAREQALIADVVQRAAMGAPDVAFRLVFDGREAVRWPAAGAGQRVADVLVGGRTDRLIAAHAHLQAGTVHGWLARPEDSRPTRASQYLFVNRRPVHSSMLRRAVEQGYAQLLPVGRFPVFALFLDVEPGHVDVNVHPRKAEVRFREESRLFGAVARAVREALLGSPLVRRVAAAVAGGPGPGTANPPAAGAETLLLEAREGPAAYTAGVRARLPALRPVGQLLSTYIVAEGPDGLYLVDQHAAHERVVYERLLAARRQGQVLSQGLVVPATVDLTPAQMAALVGHSDQLRLAGFEVEPFGAHTALVRGVPTSIPHGTPGDLLVRALAALDGEGEGADPLERLTIATACHTAIRARDALSSAEIAALLADLAATEDPYTCFHGRPTLVAVSAAALERWFLRS
jgi:DNA mismatch repair protein MutL